MATLSAVSNGVRSATATQAGTYTFNTKDKYNNANIAFTVPTGEIRFDSSQSLTCSSTRWTYEGEEGELRISASGEIVPSENDAFLRCDPGWITRHPVVYGSKPFNWEHNFTDANFTAANIKQGTTIFGITGTLDYIATVTSVPTAKNTSIIYNSTDNKYYLWRV